MHIGIDARAINWTGIGRYIRSLVEELAQLPNKHTYTLFVIEQELARARDQLKLPPERFSFVPVDASYYSWREQVRFFQQIQSVPADVFHFTHFNVPLLFKKPYVVTIHDATRFIFPGQKRQRLIEQLGYELVFAQAVKKARRVICVTEHTRQELARLPLRAGPAEVIYEGVDDTFHQPVSPLNRQKVRALLDTQDPYLLYVGVWMGHKNLRRLLEAFAQVRRSDQRLKLVVTGKPVPRYLNVVDIVRELGLMEHVIFPGFVPHELLPALYAESACFVFPSLYEGFGLPPLEAAACGTPVVTSNVSSLPEVMGQAAEYVNPEHVPSIAAGITHVLYHDDRRVQLIQAGKRRAAEFSWRECAAQTLHVYENIMDEGA